MSEIKKTIIHDLPEDLLIQIATQSKGTVVSEKLTEAVKFIYDLGIKQGDTKITAELVYYTYKLYRGMNKKQAKALFFKDFKKYFEPQRNKDGIYYLLNPKPFDLTDEAYWLMKADIRREKAKKKSKKKQAKVS
jgi:hypothetical protein